MMAFQLLRKIFFVIGFFAWTRVIGGDTNVYYMGEFDDEIKSCSGFVNEFMILNLIISTSNDEQSSMSLEGTIELKGDITPEVKVSVVVCRSTIAGCELIYTAAGFVCETLTDSTTPWYPILAVFNSDECDISKGFFTVTNLKVTLDYAKEVLTHDFVASYGAKMIFEIDGKQISCYDFTINIVEKQA